VDGFIKSNVDVFADPRTGPTITGYAQQDPEIPGSHIGNLGNTHGVTDFVKDNT
jgi:hypothetical protein